MRHPDGRIPDDEIERLKREVSLTRLIEAQGLALLVSQGRIWPVAVVARLYQELRLHAARTAFRSARSAPCANTS